MISAIIGGATSLASGLAGGLMSAKAARKAKKRSETMQEEALRRNRERERENEAWYNRRYNEDATQRADAQRLLNLTEESIRNRNRAAAGRQAVMGGTGASTAAVKEANARALSDTASQIAAQSEARKDAIEGQYMSRKDALNDQQLAIMEQGVAERNASDLARSQAIADATKAVGSAVGSGISAIGEYEKPTTGNKKMSAKEAFDFKKNLNASKFKY